MLRRKLLGVLNWAIEGLARWGSEGLKERPKAVIEATERYKKDSDTIGQWLESNMAIHPDIETKSSAAYNNYKRWTEENGYYPVGNKTFKSSLEERGFNIKKKNDGNFWTGFGISFQLK